MVFSHLIGPVIGLATYVESQLVLDNNVADNTTILATNTTLTTMVAANSNASNNNSTLALVTNETIQVKMPEGVQELLYYDNMTVDQIDLLVNVTREYPIQYAKIVFGYLMPIILLITFITNSLVIIVLWKPHMRSPTNNVLLMMAIVDLGTLISPSPWYFYIYAIGIDDMYLNPSWKCYAHHIMTDVIPILFHTASIWLALLLASQRYIYVCHPTLALTWCTSPRVTKAIVVILVTSFLHQLPKFFDNTFIPVAVVHRNKFEMACKNQIADWVQAVNLQGYYTTYFIFRILFVFIVPIIALITLNCLLFQALDRAEDKHNELFGAKYRIVESSGAIAAHLNNTTTAKCSSVDIVNINNNNNQNNINKDRKSSRVKVIYSNLSQIASQSKNKISKQLSKHSNNSALLKITPNQPKSSACHQVDMSNLIEKGTSENKSCSSSSTSSSSSSTTTSPSSSLSPSSSPSPSESCSSSPCQTQSPKELVLFRQELALPQQSLEGTESGSGADDKQADMRDGDFNSNNQSQEESGKDDSRDLNCSLCNATYEHDQQPERRRCCRSMINEGATSNGDDGGRRAVARGARLSKQNTSQCSSIGGYGTSTNDDSTTSNPATITAQNPSVTIYTGAEQGTLEAIGIIMRDHDVDEAKLTKIRSLESDNRSSACDCHNNKTQQQQRKCSKCGNRNLIIRLRDANSETKKACSSSEPSLSGNQTTQDKYRHEGISDGDGKGSGIHEEKNQHHSEHLRHSRRISAKILTKRLPFSLSDQSQETQPKNQGKQKKRLSNGAATNTNTTTTTTTTTLYSPPTTTTDSNASVVPSTKAKQQLNQQNLIAKNPIGSVGDCGKAVEQAGIKNPSFVSANTKVSTKTNHRSSVRRAFRWFSSRGSVAQGTGATTTVHMKYLDSQKTTAMLVVVVSVFLAVEVPVGVMTICHVISNSFDSLREVDFETPLKYIKLVTNFAIMISYTLNFTIYCSMSKKFRETFRELFNRGRGGGGSNGVEQERQLNDGNSRRHTGHHHWNHHQQFSSSQAETHHLAVSNHNLVGHQSGGESAAGRNHLASSLASKVRPLFNRQLATSLAGQQEQECEL